MKRTITIDPVTRIEGHAKVFLNLAEDGSLESAGMVVNELRGFERILVGVEADRMPLITARICGVCPAAHHLAAAKALDRAAGVTPPPAANLLRELLYMGHFLHSHALSLFILQGPDLVMGLDAAPEVRNIVGMVKAFPEVARKALLCRTLGQKITELVGGRGTHPVTAVAGGISFTLDAEKRRLLEEWTAELLPLVTELGSTFRVLLMKQVDRHRSLLEQWKLPVWSMGTAAGGLLSLYEGELRVTDENGRRRLDFAAPEYSRHLAEEAIDWSYMKPVQLIQGQERHVYRVGPLARLNVVEGIGTPLADRELQAMRQAYGHPSHHTLMQTYARIIELIYAAERAHEIVRDPRISGPTRVPVKLSAGRVVGHVEAPRGTLFHEYQIDENGVVRWANLLVATQQNYDAINRSIAQAAASHLLASDDPLLNAIEFAIRCYDPCLSCATHAMGHMPLDIEIRRGEQVLRRVKRSA